MLSSAEITAWLGQYLWPMFRCAAALWFMPMIGGNSVPRHARLALVVALTFLVAPGLPPIAPIDPLSPIAIIITVQQVIIGLAMALIMQLLFNVFTLAGQITSMQMGLSMAVMNDPASGSGVAVLGKWLQTLAFLMFLSVDGHLVVIRVLAESFITMPVGSFSDPTDFLDLAKLGGWLFTGALLIALPAIFSMLLVNLCFGVMSRAAPQLNIFALGFPMTMLFGMFTLYLVMMNLPSVFTELTESALWLLRNYIGV